MAANPPRFRTHHVPTPDYSLVPDCLCADCSTVRRTWADARMVEQMNQVSVEPEAPLLGPPMVWRDVTCPACRRFFCKVLAEEGITLRVHCEGCAREGR